MTVANHADASDGLEPSGRTRDGVSIGTRLDQLPITWLHLGIVAIAAAGFAFDLLEVALGSALSAVFSAPPHSVDPVTLSWMLAAMYVGAVVGAPVAGWFADRHGRRIVLSVVLLVLAATSTFAALSPDVNWLIVARVLSGLAIGAYPPLIIAYLTDIMPARRRGQLIMTVAGLAALGPVGLIFFVRWLTPLQPLGIEAWRWAFLLGAGGALVVSVLMLLLPESPRWLEARGKTRKAAASMEALERSAVVFPSGGPVPTPSDEPAGSAAGRGAFGLIAALYFLNPWSAAAFPLLMGAVLIEKGFELSDTLLYVGVSTFGPVVGTLLAAFLLDRIQRRLALALWASAMVVAGIAFAASLNPVWLMTAGVAFYVFASLYTPTLSIYGAELFPTTLRARALASAWAVNRVAAAIAPLVLLPLLRFAGVWPMFGLIIASLLLGIVLALAFGPPGRARRGVS